jgi:hypothetical protein
MDGGGDRGNRGVAGNGIEMGMGTSRSRHDCKVLQSCACVCAWKGQGGGNSQLPTDLGEGDGLGRVHGLEPQLNHGQNALKPVQVMGARRAALS